MKKILISLGVLGVVGVAAAGATFAFYNDTETSQGNIFVAGALDLKVDHTLAYYDGYFCDPLTNTIVDQCTQDNIVANGSFETPAVTGPANWDVFPSGTLGLDWQVQWSTPGQTYQGHNEPLIALRESQVSGVVPGSASDGNQYAELDSDWTGPNNGYTGEPANIKVYEDLPTIPGRHYTLSFDWSPRPNHADNKMDVMWNGAPAAPTYSAAGGSSINWTSESIPVTATGYVTRLSFEEVGTPDSLGMLLDNVKVTTEECTGPSDVIGQSCQSVFGEKDLGNNGQPFFSFGDVKPGDYGRGVISMHVYDNDAWACLFVNNKDDEENTLLPPETAYGDTSTTTGELGKYLNIFTWQDNNNDGVYNPQTETAIYGPDSLDNAGSIDAFDPTNGGLEATTTRYVGWAWCAGDLTVDQATGDISCNGAGVKNDAQSDSFSADLTAYAEQQRNNADFSCENAYEAFASSTPPASPVQ